MWPTGGRRAKCLFITLLRRFDGTRGKQTRAHSLPREEKRGEFERELLMRLDLKYKFSAICNLVPARFLWDSRTRLKARHPLVWGGETMSFPRARCAGTTLIYHWFTEKRNIPCDGWNLIDDTWQKNTVELYIYI